LDCSLKLDIVVERAVIVEVKSVDRLASVHIAQLLTYLRLHNLWLACSSTLMLQCYEMASAES